MENPKHKIRCQFKDVRKRIPKERRLIASKAFLETFKNSKDIICSYASFGEELDTSLLNDYLLQKQCLALPRMNRNGLSVHHVTSLADLEPNAFGILEPKLDCKKLIENEVSLILVPGIAFDRCKHRLGYGKGCYDRFLSNFKAHAIGVGFKECLLDNLPVNATDVPLNTLALF